MGSNPTPTASPVSEDRKAARLAGDYRASLAADLATDEATMRAHTACVEVIQAYGRAALDVAASAQDPALRTGGGRGGRDAQRRARRRAAATSVADDGIAVGPGLRFLRVRAPNAPRRPPRRAPCWPRWIASPKLQKAARAFLLRLVAENGVEEAAPILRRLADELEALPELYADEGYPPDQEAH